MSLYEKLKGRLASILSPHFLGREQEALVELSLVTVDEATQDVQDSLDGLQEQLNDLHTEYGAGLVGIEDAGGYFESFTVEGALQELGAGGGGGGGFNPALPQTITGKWKFTQPVAFSDNGFEGNLSAPILTDDRSYTLPDKSGTLATLDDITGAGTILAGDGIDVSTGPEGTTITNTIPQINLIPGSNVGITGTYPNITISAAGGGGGGGAVNSVNGKVGDVIITYSDVDAAPTVHTHTMGQVTGLIPAMADKAPAIHTHPAEAITSGVFTVDRLGQGFPSSETFLRGDGIWATPPGGGGGGGSVTSVNVQGSEGLSFTGGPITSSGTITGTLSTNLQSWSNINPSTKFNKPSGTPSQYVRGDGSLATFPSVGTGTVTSVTGGNGLTGTVTSSGSITLGTPSAITLSSTNSVTTSSHTHAFTPGGSASQYIRGNGTLATFPSIPSTDDFALKKDFTYLGQVSGGTYYSHIPSNNGLSYMYHAAGNGPSDAPANPARQTAVLAMDTNWGPVQLAITNEETPQAFIRANNAVAWSRVWTSGDFNPSSKFNTPTGTTSQYIRGNGSLATFPTIPTSANYVATTGNQTGIAGNKTFTGNITANTISDSIGNVRKPDFRTANGTITLGASDVNRVVEKSNNTAYTYTIPSGHGSQGDIITFVNSGTSGNLTISGGSGVTIYRNGTSGNITVRPGSTVTVYRSATANRWVA